MLRQAVGIVSKAAAAGTLAGGSYTAYLFQTDEGTRRAITVYASFLPVVAQYRLVEAKHKLFPPATAEIASAEWQALDKRFAGPTVAKLGLLLRPQGGTTLRTGNTCFCREGTAVCRQTSGTGNRARHCWLFDAMCHLLVCCKH